MIILEGRRTVASGRVCGVGKQNWQNTWVRMDKGEGKPRKKEKGVLCVIVGRVLSKASKSSYTRDTSASRRWAWVFFCQFFFTDAFCSGRGGIAPYTSAIGSCICMDIVLLFFYHTWGNLWHCLVFFDISFAVSSPLASCVDKHVVAWMLGCFAKDHVILSVDVDQE